MFRFTTDLCEAQPLLTIAVQVYQPRAGCSNWVWSDRKGETTFEMSRIGAPSRKQHCFRVAIGMA